MSDAKGVEVRGAKELRRKLKKMGGDLADMKAIHQEAADMVLEEAQRRAPVRSGILRRGIKTGATQRKAVIRSGSTGKSKNYAARQHWVQQKGKGGEQYVYKAVGATGWDVVDLYHDRVDELIDKMNRSGTRGDY